MPIYPDARLRALPENESQPKINPRLVILHSAVDSPRASSLYGFFARPDVRVEAHFFVRFDGQCEQYLDTTVRADHAVAANDYSVGIETEDDGDPDRTPWSEKQIEALARLLVWLSKTHGIPLRLVSKPDEAGVAYHSQFNRPDGSSPWSIARGKTCPGRARVPQVLTVIEKAKSLVSREGEMEQALKQLRGAVADLHKKLDDIERKLERLDQAIRDEDAPAHRKTRLTIRAYLRSVVDRLGGDLSGWDG